MLHFTAGTQNDSLSSKDLKNGLYKALDKLGNRNKVLVVPPDQTRIHSRAGDLSRFAWEYYGEKLNDILPALGTHTPMTDYQLSDMFGKIPLDLFRKHDWRNDVITLGKVPASIISEVSEGKLSFDWEAQVNRLLVEGGHDLILSIGQVVPHEVIGMANFNKNIFVGTGGTEGINKSHYLGAVYGMERIMGRADNPVRSVLNYASCHFSSNLPQIIYVLTVIGKDPSGMLVPKGLYIGDDQECFYKAAELSLKVNFEILDKPLDKVIVHLDPSEYKSTWLGNKAIYRTRMALANGGDLVILAPGLKEFGEDAEIDRLIRKYGYRGRDKTIQAVEENADLSKNLAAAAHLIHGSSEGRFNIIYSTGKLSKQEIEGVGFQYAELNEMMNLYKPSVLKAGFNTLRNGQKVYYISNPALGLWTTKMKFI